MNFKIPTQFIIQLEYTDIVSMYHESYQTFRYDRKSKNNIRKGKEKKRQQQKQLYT